MPHTEMENGGVQSTQTITPVNAHGSCMNKFWIIICGVYAGCLKFFI
jgi:hypothetical protein